VVISLEGMGRMDAFSTYRPLLLSIAYRMLGSATDAEDIVQDAYLRYRAADRDDIVSPKAYLTTVVTRLCLDELKSARVRREEYIGPWLPEPLLTGGADALPDESAERRESLSMAFLVLLETLTPRERAVFLLHDVFDYPHDEIASMLDTTAANSRQILHRSRQRIAERRPRFERSEEAARDLLQRFLMACQLGDLQGLTETLAREAAVVSDGGGKVSAARRPVLGRDKVSRFLLGVLRKAPPGMTATLDEVNGMPAILQWTGGMLFSATLLHLADGRIQEIFAILNPDKLTYLVGQIQRRAANMP
jgi:RNA polymerase sigma-70 factor, ECF subfamily